jgi:hypothetical protein
MSRSNWWKSSRRSGAQAGLPIGVLTGAALVLTLVFGERPVVGGQGTTVGSGSVRALRTPWGHPDLQGVWTNATDTPLERPIEFGERARLTEAELQEREARAATNLANEPVVTRGDPGTYNAFWRDPIRPTGRTSLIIDPPDGRLPPLTPEAGRRREERTRDLASHPFWRADGPEDRPYFERCIGRGWPRVGGTYQFTYQIFQNAQYVVLLAEMVNERLVIPLDGRPHGPIRQWMGDPRGRWEGDTLVVETVNYPDLPNSLLVGVDTLNYPYGQLGGSARNLRLVERFRRVDADTLDYQFTVHDPTTFTRPWTVSMPMRPAEGLFEYACHEGNYGIRNVLSGHRAEEAAAGER